MSGITPWFEECQQRFGDFSSQIVLQGQQVGDLAVIVFRPAVKSGRAYVPIDTALPQRRIDSILAISHPALLLTPEETARLSAGGEPARGAPVQTDDPFYILFTSGSTGEPKGVVITLACLQHFLGWMLAEQKFGDLRETFLNQAPFSFDLSVMDLHCSLATGGTLFSISRDLLVAGAGVDVVHEHERVAHAALLVVHLAVVPGVVA